MSDSATVRRTFLDYFKQQTHTEVASASLVPHDDPTLLFTNAGMNQFKDYFTGKRKPTFLRATTAQKCVRAGGKHNDLENVGRTARHQTFFEMLGNFSFGDYFKPDAIAFAHELLTKRYAIDPKRLVYTVHETDDEARTLWRKVAGVADDRIISLGDKDNFWAMGETGPCGPCSEIHYHQGDGIPCAVEAGGGKCEGPACDCDRWIEIWNLVFMQFEQFGPGDRRPLPKPSVDTGMGLERLCAVLAGVRSNYETDLLRPLIAHAETLSGKTFVPTDYEGTAVSLRAIADHARAAALLIADGVFPDKTGREYVLRRIMRRGIYHGWLIGIREPFMHLIAADVIEKMAPIYPELRERAALIGRLTLEEETRFRETLERGVRMLDETFKGKAKSVSGELAFKLYDTFGFPLDLTEVIAEQQGATVDKAGFERNMAAQRARSEFQGSGEVAVAAVFQAIAERIGPTKFAGYEGGSNGIVGKSKIVALVEGGAEVQTVGPYSKQVAIVTAETPFYGEQGGQIGDAGTLASAGAKMTVTDVKRPVSTLWVHLGAVTEGELKVGDEVTLSVDGERRDAIRRNHSATHLLHWALRHVLGPHVTQKGSLVAPDRLRFDFSHNAPADGGRAPQGRGAGQRPHPAQRRHGYRGASHRPGQGGGRHRLLRREVRRHRPGRDDGRFEGVLRRHARRPHRRHRRLQADRGERGRPGRPPHRGRDRRRRARLRPVAGARAGRGGGGAPRRAARGRRPRGQAASRARRPRQGDREAAAQAGLGRRPRSGRRGPRHQRRPRARHPGRRRRSEGAARGRRSTAGQAALGRRRPGRRRGGQDRARRDGDA